MRADRVESRWSGVEWSDAAARRPIGLSGLVADAVRAVDGGSSAVSTPSEAHHAIACVHAW